VRLYKQRSCFKDQVIKVFSYEAELLKFQESKEVKLNAPPDNVESFN